MKSLRRRSGFTILEVMLALAIFVLLASAVFFSVQAVSSASAVLGVEQVRARKIDAFQSWCRKGFRSLSSRSEIILRTRDAGAAGRAVELLIRQAPGAFSLGEFDALGSDMILGAIPDGRGTATISVARFPGTWTLEESLEKLGPEDWFPILEEVQTLQWTFWEPAVGDFVEEWPPGRAVPELVRLNMTLGTGEEIESVFHLPRLTARGAWGLPDEQEETQPPQEEEAP